MRRGSQARCYRANGQRGTILAVVSPAAATAAAAQKRRRRLRARRSSKGSSRDRFAPGGNRLRSVKAAPSGTLMRTRPLTAHPFASSNGPSVRCRSLSQASSIEGPEMASTAPAIATAFAYQGCRPMNPDTHVHGPARLRNEARLQGDLRARLVILLLRLGELLH